MKIDLKPELEKKLQQKAEECGLDAEKLGKLIIDSWLKNEGSVWGGRKKIVLDWPAGFIFVLRKEVE